MAKDPSPKIRLLAKICANAQASVDRAASFRPGNKLLANTSLLLSSVPVAVIQLNDKVQRQAAAITLASRLSGLIEDIPSFLKEIFTEAWGKSNPTPVDWDYLAFACDEISCLAASSDRDAELLEWQLRHSLASTDLDPDEVFNFLFPKPVKFYVACKVIGAKRFHELTALEPSAQQSSTIDGGITWVGPSAQLRKFLEKVSPNADECAISIDVEAVDRRSAARLGRRRITELLDQYVAGHRLIRLSIGSEALAARVGASTAEIWLPQGKSTAKASPLVAGWPEGLREGLRMAHLARQSDSPLATAALSWATLEACGLEHQHAADLSRAISLQALRQQVIESHRLVLDSVQAEIQYSRADVRNWTRRLEKHKRGLARLLPNHPAHDDLERRIDATSLIVNSAQERFNVLENKLDAPLAIVKSYAVSNEWNHLVNLDGWLNLLLPAKSPEGADLTIARSALDALLPELSPLAARQVIDWRQRLTTAIECGNWLTMTQNRIESLADALYGARNATFHSGVFSATGDVILGIGGVMLVDLTLEFLGNWYRHAPGDRSHKLPVEIIQELSSRQVNLVRQLNATKQAAYELNVTLLTSPLSIDGWNRK